MHATSPTPGWYPDHSLELNDAWQAYRHPVSYSRICIYKPLSHSLTPISSTSCSVTISASLSNSIGSASSTMPTRSHDRSTWQIGMVLASSRFRRDVTMRPEAENSLSHSALIA
ncbi:hypothetical protein MRS44_018796 [Fusarium solani]|uniref:uncharacterized protein n=1 Tax=Fusarium solani TaxID=169388 RepID=UPI0032C413C6|nr:hypothetical protein MRS44_018796 [Fusarium solani]